MHYENSNGFVLFYDDPWNEKELVIAKLFIQPEHRGHKAGYGLLDMVKAYASEHGHKMLWLECWPYEMKDEVEKERMTKALIRYYSAYGFKSMKTNKARMKLKLKGGMNHVERKQSL